MNEEKFQFEHHQKLNSWGLWFLGRFIFYRLQIKKSVILLDRTLSLVRRFVEFICFVIAALGWLSLVWYLYEKRETILQNPLDLTQAQHYQHPLLLLFLLALGFNLFLYYRHSVKSAAQVKINLNKFKLDEVNGQFIKKNPWNAALALDDETKNILADAYLLAAKLKQSEVTARHLFRILLKSKTIQALFIRLGIDANKLVSTLDKYLISDDKLSKTPVISQAVQEIIILAALEAYNHKHTAINVLDLAWPCYSRDPILAEILYDAAIDDNKLKNGIEWFRVSQRLLKNHQIYKQAASFKPLGVMNRAYTAIATPTLDHFSTDLTMAARMGRLELCLNRTKEFLAIFDAYTSGQTGVLLIGPSGVGKRTVVEGLAQLMVQEEVPKFLQDKRLVELDLASLIAGADASESQERLLTCLNEINRAGNIILYIANIERLMGISAGDEESFELAEVLVEALNKQALFCLATATTENYTKFIEGNSLGEVMTTVGIAEPNFNQTIQILESKTGSLEARYGIYLTYDALERAVTLAAKYIRDFASPLKDLNLLQKAVNITSKAAHNNPDKVICNGEAVAQAIQELTGIPAVKVSEDESQKLLNLEANIHERMVGQEEAVKAVSSALRRARADLKDGARPIASFLFLGPTGVGKTELAKTVSEVYFGDEKYMIRLDMSEYQEADSVNKIIGDADGALGYLTEAVRKKPFSLILLDEIEKAHPDILNLFLQLLDDGRLTDGQGRTISFAQSIVIATSNIGSVIIQESLKDGLDINLIKQDLIDNQLNRYMRPELVNRFDGIVVFKPLSEDNIITIATLMLKKMKKTLAAKGVDFQADKDGVAILAKAGYDPKFGARPLRRLLQDQVEDEIANLFLAGKLQRRDTVFIGNTGKVGITKGKVL